MSLSDTMKIFDSMMVYSMSVDMDSAETETYKFKIISLFIAQLQNLNSCAIDLQGAGRYGLINSMFNTFLKTLTEKRLFCGWFGAEGLDLLKNLTIGMFKKFNFYHWKINFWTFYSQKNKFSTKNWIRIEHLTARPSMDQNHEHDKATVWINRKHIRAEYEVFDKVVKLDFLSLSSFHSSFSGFWRVF